MKISASLAGLFLAGVALPCASRAQATYSEDFTGAKTTNYWYFLNGACLTAGSSTSLTSPNVVPSCGAVWTSYYAPSPVSDIKLVGGSAGTVTGGTTTGQLDPVGSGALRFTNGYYLSSPTQGESENGSIVSTNTFDASEGVQISFKTVTYRGDAGGLGKDGADGMSFFLLDGSLKPGLSYYNGIGNVGGSLGYSCSNIGTPYDGLEGAYLGLGIDEYGNFLHGAQLSPGYTGVNLVNPGNLGYQDPQGDNSQLGYGFLPNRIGLRGAGNVAWGALTHNYPTYYPSTTAAAAQGGAVQNTCAVGRVLNYNFTPNASLPVCPVGGITGSTAAFTGTTTLGSPTVSVTAVTSGTLMVGQLVSGTGIPSNTTLVTVAEAVGGGYALRMSNTATRTGSVSVSAVAISPVTFKGSLTQYTNGVAAATVTSTSGELLVGQIVTGTGVPSGTTIQGVVPGLLGVYSLQLSANATATTVGGTLTGSANANCPAIVSDTNLASNNYTQVLDYAPISGAYAELPSTVIIANEPTTARPTGLTTLGVPFGNVFLYSLKITNQGLLSLAYSVNGGSSTPVLTNQSISASNGPLPATLRFGFAGATGGSLNIHEILCFKAAPAAASSSSASTNQQQSSKFETNSQAYFSYYDQNDWTGRMTAYGLVDTAGVLSLNSSANWDSQCVLTGVSNFTPAICPSTGLATPAYAQYPTAGTTPGAAPGRVMLTWNGTDTAANPGTAGIPFEWPGTGAGITLAEENILDAGDATLTSNRLNYLRGVTTNEQNSSGVGLYRARDAILGDIVDSSSAWVGPPSSPYKLPFKDRYVGAADLTPENNATYANFITANQSRLNVVYVGANDGFLHAFRTGSQDAGGNLINSAATPNDGAEVLAYMPGSVLNTIHNSTTSALDLSNPQYSHNFFVDATPGTGDLFYGGAWHTWLVGGLGAGGAGIYALDITDTSTTSFNESAEAVPPQAAVVQGDWSSATISCAGNTTCGRNLGNTYGTPLIRRLHNGMWGAIFGNGLGSTSGDAGIFVMTVNQTSGVKTFYYLSTGTTDTPNGITYVTAADLDGDHITDYVYAGDVQGHVWRFDLTSATATTWAVGAANAPLFSAPNGQPITTPVVVASAQVVGSTPTLIVAFGTGQRTPLTTTTAAYYVTGLQQSLYAIWDWNLATWNSKAVTQYNSLSTTTSPAQIGIASGLSAPYTLGVANLQAQTYQAGATAGTVDSSNTAIAWAQCSSATPSVCTGGKFGWYANLPGTGGSGSTVQNEQIVSAPALYQQALIVNSITPAANTPLACNTTADIGNTYIISLVSGGTFTSSSGNKTSAFLGTSDTAEVGLTTNSTGAMTVFTTTEGTSFLVGQALAPSTTAVGTVTALNLPTNIQVNRLTWTQLR